MDPGRKRRLRLIVCLTAAVLLAGGLMYTSFSVAAEALTPTQLLAQAKPGVTYQLTGTVVAGSVRHLPDGALDFSLADRGGASRTIAVDYSGAVPDPFRVGRELIVSGTMHGSSFIASPGSMITKCPSKYSPAKST
ncbi:MAG: cytochrome c maturation protein CcmE [Solirubrobacteraceae bacterium]|jgi:cytochrome c-type biogenesis protein CcmE